MSALLGLSISESTLGRELHCVECIQSFTSSTSSYESSRKTEQAPMGCTTLD
ncbi:hypothetical protein AVEN_272751-1, partial [Araneus ventricosus]